jgi:hypothetical protein
MDAMGITKQNTSTWFHSNITLLVLTHQFELRRSGGSQMKPLRRLQLIPSPMTRFSERYPRRIPGLDVYAAGNFLCLYLLS